LLEQIPDPIGQGSGDGAYDTRTCYEVVLQRQATPTFMPRRIRDTPERAVQADDGCLARQDKRAVRLASAVGSRPSSWSKLRFSIITTTMCANLAIARGGRDY